MNSGPSHGLATIIRRPAKKNKLPKPELAAFDRKRVHPAVDTGRERKWSLRTYRPVHDTSVQRDAVYFQHRTSDTNRILVPDVALMQPCARGYEQRQSVREALRAEQRHPVLHTTATDGDGTSGERRRRCVTGQIYKRRPEGSKY